MRDANPRIREIVPTIAVMSWRQLIPPVWTGEDKNSVADALSPGAGPAVFSVGCPARLRGCGFRDLNGEEPQHSAGVLSGPPNTSVRSNAHEDARFCVCAGLGARLHGPGLCRRCDEGNRQS